MKVVRIRGPRSRFAAVVEIPGVMLEGASRHDEGDTHLLSTFATDEAIAALRAAGLEVDVLGTEEDVRGRLHGDQG